MQIWNDTEGYPAQAYERTEHEQFEDIAWKLYPHSEELEVAFQQGKGKSAMLVFLLYVVILGAEQLEKRRNREMEGFEKVRDDYGHRSIMQAEDLGSEED